MITYIGEEMLKTVLFFWDGWVGEVVRNNDGNRKIRVLFAQGSYSLGLKIQGLFTIPIFQALHLVKKPLKCDTR